MKNLLLIAFMLAWAFAGSNGNMNEREFMRLFGTKEQILAKYDESVAACEKNEPFGCVFAGLITEDSDYFGHDSDKAKAFFEKGCALNDGFGCVNLARVYAEGRGETTQDYKTALKWYLRGCELGQMIGCGAAGELLYNNPEITPDYPRAKELMERACESGADSRACLNMGLYYWDGIAESADLARAKAYFKRVCDQGDSVGCEMLDKAGAGEKPGL